MGGLAGPIVIAAAVVLGITGLGSFSFGFQATCPYKSAPKLIYIVFIMI